MSNTADLSKFKDHPAIRQPDIMWDRQLRKGQYGYGKYCARYWKEGWQIANKKTLNREMGSPVIAGSKYNAGSYKPIVKSVGYVEIQPLSSGFLHGDVIVSGAAGGDAKYGHIQTYNAKQGKWIADRPYNTPYVRAPYRNTTTFYRHKDLVAAFGSGPVGGSSGAVPSTPNVPASPSNGSTSFNLSYDASVANQKANEAARGYGIDVRTAFMAILDLPNLLSKRAEVIEAMGQGQTVDYSFDINTETEIEAAVNSILIASTRFDSMKPFSEAEGFENYAKIGNNNNLISKVYRWNKYINPFYKDMFGKDFHNDMNVRPLYFWSQIPHVRSQDIAMFPASDFYKMLYDTGFKALIGGKEVHANALVDANKESAEDSKDNDDHHSQEAFFQMLETRYVKAARGDEKKYQDTYTLVEAMKESLIRDGVPPVIAEGLTQIFATLAPVSTAILDGVNAVGEYVSGNTTTTYTGEFPPEIKKRIGSLQASKNTNIMEGYPPRIRAIADLVSRHEGTHEALGHLGYAEYYGHSPKGRALMKESMAGRRGHPEIKIGAKQSNAAGRYQAMGITDSSQTWSDINGRVLKKKGFEGKDFGGGKAGGNFPLTVKNQDRFFEGMLIYRKVKDKVLAGDWYGVWKHMSTKHASAWTSLPTSWDTASAVQHTMLSGKQWVEAAQHLTKFYEGATSGTQVETDGPSIFTKAFDAVQDAYQSYNKTRFENAGFIKEEPKKTGISRSSNASIPTRTKAGGEFFKDGKDRSKTKHKTDGLYFEIDREGKKHLSLGFDETSEPSVKGTELVAPLSGVVTYKKIGSSVSITLNTDVKHLVIGWASVDPKSMDIAGGEGREKTVNAGDVIGYLEKRPQKYSVFCSAKIMGVPFNLFGAKPLNEWPTKVDYELNDYLSTVVGLSLANGDPVSDEAWVKSFRAGNIISITDGPNPEVISISDRGNVERGGDGSASQQQQYMYEEMRGHQYTLVKDPSGDGPLRDGVSVFSNNLVYTNVLKTFLKPFNYANSMMLPQVKGYTVVGNEDEDYYAEGVAMKEPIIYEMPPVQTFKLSCNDDYNPVDVLHFSVVNPAHMAHTPLYWNIDKSGDVNQAHTQFYNPAYLEKARIRSGTKVSFKIGYTNNPNFNPTVFNGVIKEVSSDKDYVIECIAEGYGAELLHTEIGNAKPIDYTNGHNASTGAVIGISLLDEAITHFGARIGSWRFAKDYVTSIFRFGSVDEFSSGAEWTNDTIFEGKGRIGDMRDPENKALVAPWSWGDNIFNLWYPTRANAAHRAYVNIFADVIESVHDKYSTDFIRSWASLFTVHEAAAWRYYAYKSTPWSIMKEMEYRHPGTICKPLIYDERMTLFFGVPFQNYIARDLSGHFMTSTALANRFEDLDSPYTEEYLKLRPSRMESVTNYHMIHSDFNLISNQISLNRDFYTRVNVLEYNKKFDGGAPDSNADVHTMTIDDNMAAHDIRAKTIALGGCHKEYSAWMYGTTELKKEIEKMYDGSIIVVGNPHIKAGDYAHLEDRIRGFSGTIKVRECQHYVTENDGYITVITPGLWAEPAQFTWNTQLYVFSSLGRFSADLLSEVSKDELLNRMVDYQSLLIASSKPRDYSAGDSLFSAVSYGLLPTVGAMWATKKVYNKVKFKNVKAFEKGLKAFGNGVLDTTRAYGGKSLAAIKEMSTYKASAEWVKNTPDRWPGMAKKWGSVSKWAKASKFLRGGIALGRIALLLARGIGAFVAGFLMSIPIVGWVVLAAIEIITSFVAFKMDEKRLTRQPIVFTPIMHNHVPYLAGVDGFINNGYLSSLMTNLKRTWKQIVRAKDYYDIGHDRDWDFNDSTVFTFSNPTSDAMAAGWGKDLVTVGR